MQKEKIFNFKRITAKMRKITKYLSKNNAIKLKFDTTKEATAIDTHLIEIDDEKNEEIKVCSQNNVYFIFDKDFKCRYVGKKGNGDDINGRLKLHLKSNNTLQNNHPTYSCINNVCEYINKENEILYLITFCVEPSFMAEGVESYFIDYFRNKEEADWVKRK